jgi:hypothetical protein
MPLLKVQNEIHSQVTVNYIPLAQGVHPILLPGSTASLATSL